MDDCNVAFTYAAFCRFTGACFLCFASPRPVSTPVACCRAAFASATALGPLYSWAFLWVLSLWLLHRFWRQGWLLCCTLRCPCRRWPQLSFRSSDSTSWLHKPACFWQQVLSGSSALCLCGRKAYDLSWWASIAALHRRFGVASCLWCLHFTIAVSLLFLVLP